MDDLAQQMFGDNLATAPTRRTRTRQHRANRNHRRKAAALVVGATSMILGGTTALAVTGAAVAGEHNQTRVGTHLVPLSDGRAVTCAVPQSTTPALDCDWTNATTAQGITPTHVPGLSEALADDVLCLTLIDGTGVALSCDWQGRR